MKKYNTLDYDVERQIGRWCARELRMLDKLHDFMYSPGIDKIMVGITSTGNLGLIWILVTLILMVAFPERKEGYCLIIAMVLSVVIGNISIKNIVRRLRPFFHKEYKLLIKRPWDYSFPSGHTLVSFAASTVFFLMDWRIGILSYLYSCLIALSRLYLRVHFFTDVFFSMLLGIGLGVLAEVLYNTRCFGLL